MYQWNELSQELEDLKEKGLYTNIRTLEGPQGAWLKINGEDVLNLSSNNYLGLADDEEMVKSAIGATAEWGVGPGAVRTIAGTMSLHNQLEEDLANFKGVEATIMVQSGFCAIGLLPGSNTEPGLQLTDCASPALSGANGVQPGFSISSRAGFN